MTRYLGRQRVLDNHFDEIKTSRAELSIKIHQTQGKLGNNSQQTSRKRSVITTPESAAPHPDIEQCVEQAFYEIAVSLFDVSDDKFVKGFPDRLCQLFHGQQGVVSGYFFLYTVLY